MQFVYTLRSIPISELALSRSFLYNEHLFIISGITIVYHKVFTQTDITRRASICW